MDLHMKQSTTDIVNSTPERWITGINNGVVTLIQRIDADAFVISINEIAGLCENREMLSDEQARAILEAVLSR
jgi:hypothetical protein